MNSMNRLAYHIHTAEHDGSQLRSRLKCSFETNISIYMHIKTSFDLLDSLLEGPIIRSRFYPQSQ